jgi:hypothetical protein
MVKITTTISLAPQGMEIKIESESLKPICMGEALYAALLEKALPDIMHRIGRELGATATLRADGPVKGN